MREVAKRAGVHYSTVSLALSNSPKLPPAKCLEIQELARSMGYVRDPMLSALTTYRKTRRPVSYQATLAWINNWSRPEELLENYTFHEYYRGASARAHELGYMIEEFPLRARGMSAKKCMSILRARNIQGLLLAPQEFPGRTLELDFSRFATLAFGYSLRPHVHHVITSQLFHATQLLMTELAQLGYRRIGLFFQRDWDEKVDHAVTAGWQIFNQEHSKKVHVPAFISHDVSQDDFNGWYTKHRPDAIISYDLRIPGWLQELGVKVPKDVGYALLSISGEETQNAGIYQHGLRIGAIAVDLLANMLQRGEFGLPQTPIRTLVEGEWRPNKTVRPQT